VGRKSIPRMMRCGSWDDTNKLYATESGRINKRWDMNAYRLALGLIHYHNALPQQNRLVCAEWAREPLAIHCPDPSLHRLSGTQLIECALCTLCIREEREIVCEIWDTESV